MASKVSIPGSTLVTLNGRDLKRLPGQREVDAMRVRDIAKRFDWRAWDAPIVAPNTTGHYIIEGQHGVGAIDWLCTNDPKRAKELGADITHLPCRLIDGEMSKEEMHALVLSLNSNTKDWTVLERWNCRAESGEELVLRANIVLEQLGLTLGGGTLSSIGSVAKVETLAREDMLHRVLALILRAFPVDGALTSDELQGRLDGDMLIAWKMYLQRRKERDGTMPTPVELAEVIQRKTVRGLTDVPQRLSPRIVMALANKLCADAIAQGRARPMSSGNRSEWYREAIGTALHGKRWADYA